MIDNTMIERARKAALRAANEACRNMEGELDLDAMTAHFLTTLKESAAEIAELRAKVDAMQWRGIEMLPEQEMPFKALIDVRILVHSMMSADAPDDAEPRQTWWTDPKVLTAYYDGGGEWRIAWSNSWRRQCLRAVKFDVRAYMPLPAPFPTQEAAE